MADTDTNDRAEETARPGGRRATATVAGGAAPPGSVEGERRAFEAAGQAGREAGRQAARDGGDATREGMTTARDFARTAAEQTRAVGQQGREMTREAAGAWRAAAEPFVAMQMEMNRWFDEMWRQAAGLGAMPSLHKARPFLVSPAAMLGLPATDVMETDTAYKLCIEAPGMTEQDLELQIRGDALLVSGHKAEDKANASSTFRISERRFGAFERSFPLPPDVDRERIEAGFRDGVLTVTLPKSGDAAAPARSIEIKRS